MREKNINITHWALVWFCQVTNTPSSMLDMSNLARVALLMHTKLMTIWDEEWPPYSQKKVIHFFSIGLTARNALMGIRASHSPCQRMQGHQFAVDSSHMQIRPETWQLLNITKRPCCLHAHDSHNWLILWVKGYFYHPFVQEQAGLNPLHPALSWACF